MAMEQFSYSSLPLLQHEIRIFKLLPDPDASSPEPVRIQLIKANIEKPPAFYALSYHWGAPDSELQDSRDILVDSRCLSITRSLETFLRALRATYGDCSFWADQICINQPDKDEKYKQIRHMSKIFSKSTQTIGWLGKEIRLSTVANKTLEELGREASQLGINQLVHTQKSQLYIDENDDDGGSNHLDSDYAARSQRLVDFLIRKGNILDLPGLDGIVELCKADYFVRGWIREEIVLPKKLVLGWVDGFIDGETFSAAILLLQVYVDRSERKLIKDMTTIDVLTKFYEKTASLRTYVQTSVAVRQEYHFLRFERFFNMANILRKCSKLEFTNPEDRVLGVLGLANDCEELGLPISHSKSMTWVDIFTDTTKRIIQKNVKDDDWVGGVNFLSLCGLPRISLSALENAKSKCISSSQLPSWVPDLDATPKSHQTHSTLAEFITSSSSHQFDASRGVRNSITTEEQDSVNKNVLLCKAIVVDKIKKVGSVVAVDEIGPEESIDDPFQILRDIESFALQSEQMVKSDRGSIHPYRREPQKLVDAAWRVPILDHEFPSNPTFRRRATDFSREGHIVLLGKGKRDTIQHVKSEEKHYLEQAEALSLRRPFLGEKGFVGIGPRTTRQGDLVCVIHGGIFPFILREKRRAESAYTLVGEAYCDGIMDGEALHMGIPSQKLKLE